ncbi:MAG: hypothetical protein ACR2QK_18975 [Acidimicrobiales bacterium]
MGTAMVRIGDQETAESAGPVWLRTPLLVFREVPYGSSQSRPILVGDGDDRPADVEVVIPPLAPFSVIHRPGRTNRTDKAADGADLGLAVLWVRYDAASPMARDRGQIVVRDRRSGAEWTVLLEGSGTLAFPEPA